MLVDYITIMDAPANDDKNKEWKQHIINLINENNYNENLPRILIEIEEHIDALYQDIINLLG
jgi:L-rhamnose mutarotase